MIVTGTPAAPTGSPAFNALPANVMPVPDACVTDNNAVYTPGNDACGADLIVRSNDTITYQMQYVTSGADTVTIVSNLPGPPELADWVSVPPQCTGAGSAISNGGQRLTCVIAVTSSASQSILPQAKVRGTNANGTPIPMPATTVSGATPGNTLNANAGFGSTVLPVRVSSAPLYDLEKSYGSMAYVTGPNGTTPGWLISWSLGVRAPYGAKGIEPLNATGLTVTDALANLTVSPSNPTVQSGLRANALLYKSVPWTSPVTAVPCGSNALTSLFNSTQGLPNVSLTPPNPPTNPAAIYVGDNGTCTATQPGNAAGGDISVSLTGVNWTNPYPVTNSTSGSKLPYGYYLSSNRLAIWVPATVFNGVSGQLQIGNTYTGVVGTSISGQSLIQPTTPDSTRGGTLNDSTTLNTPIFGAPAPSFEKRYQNCTPTAGCINLGIAPYNHAENGVAMPGSAYISGLYIFNNNSASPVTGVTACDKIDNTKNILTELTAGDGGIYGSYYTPPLVRGTDYTVEYGTGGLGGAGSSWANQTDFAVGTCADDQSPAWYSSLAAVPGGAASVSKIRVHFLIPVPATATMGIYVALKNTSPSLVAGMGSPAGTLWPAGTKINNWGTFATNNSSGVPGLDNGVLKNWVTKPTGSYLPNGGVNGSLGDTVNQGYATARVTKTVGAITDPSGTLVPGGATATQIAAGNTVTYVLTPTLTSPVAAASSSVQVKDILPPYLDFVAGSASLAPSSVQNNTPGPGYTTIVWDIPGVIPNTAIAPITFRALSASTGPSGESLPNFAVVSSPADPGTCVSSGGIYDGILNPGYTIGADDSATGTTCLRAARRDLTLSTPPGFRVSKAVDRSQIELNGSFTYTLSWVSIGSQMPAIDLIDALPYFGDGNANPALNANGRTPASAFVGSRGLAAVPAAVVGDSGATYWYTNAPAATINRDPADPSNGGFSAPGGIWCGTIGGAGTACPASLADVTAIRMISNTPLTSDALRSLSYTIATNGNAKGDLYANDFTARGAGLSSVVTSNTSSVVVTIASVAGNVYADINGNGVLDNGETGIANVQVCLSGYAFGPNGADNGGAPDDAPVGPICQQTAADGSYLFANVFAGQYSLTEKFDTASSPGLAGYHDGLDAAGTLGGTVVNGNGTSDDVISAITVPIGANATNYLFGEIPVGTLVVDKTVVGVPSNTGWTFTLSTATPGCAIPATLTNPATTPPGSGVSVSFPNLPVYSTTAATLTSCVYDVAETAQAGYQLNAANSTLSGSVTIDGTTTLNVENDQLYGDLVVTKSVTGGPAGYSGSFPITAVCTFNGASVTGIAPSATQNVTAGTGADGQLTFANIPQGATCTISEGTLPSPPTSYTFGTPTLTQPSAAIGATAVDASVLNTLSQQFGSLDVTKSVSGAPSAYSDAFAITATCTLDGAPVTGITPSATQTVTAGTGASGTVTFANIPQGAICTVGEGTPPTPPASYAWAASTPTITQPGAIAATPATASVVNTMVLQVAGLTVVKTVAGGPSAYSASFPVSVACTFNGGPVTGITPSGTQNVTAGTSTSGSVNFGNIPQGSACTVSEGTLPTPPTSYTWGTPAITQPGAIAAAGSTATVANTLTQQFGSLVVTKTVTGGPPSYSGSFPITAACTLNGTPVTGITPSATQNATAGTGTPGTVTFANIPQGAICTTSEGTLPAPPASYTFGTPAITQPAAAIGATPGSASVVNTLSQQFGSLAVTKSVSGAPSNYSGAFPITAACVLNGAPVTGITPSATQTVTAGTSAPGAVTFANIPQGATCTISEGTLPTPPASYAWVAGTPTFTQPVGAIAATPVTASVVNTMAQQVAGLTVVKTVAGGPAAYSDSFAVSVACTLDGNPVTGITPSATQSVTAGTSASGSVNFANIPEGSLCTVSEGTLPIAPTGYTWGTPAITQSGAIAATGSTATVANTLTALDPPFHLTKTVTGGPSTLNGTFVFDIDCGAAGTFTQSVTLANATSGSVAISNIPFGSVCVFSEASNLPAAPDGFAWGALPAAQSQAIDGSDVSFVNTLNADDTPPTLPSTVPALRDAMLALLALLMVGVGAHAARSRERR
jgi:hypothetical protein